MAPGFVTCRYCLNIIILAALVHHFHKSCVEVPHNPDGAHNRDGDDQHGKDEGRHVPAFFIRFGVCVQETHQMHQNSGTTAIAVIDPRITVSRRQRRSRLSRME